MKAEKLFASDADPMDFFPPILRLTDRPPNPLGRTILWVLLGLIIFLILWGMLGHLDIVAVAEGKLIPESYLKIVQPSEAGILKEILVKEGEKVQAGQILMRMDPYIGDAEAKAIRLELQRKRLNLRRIEAELAGEEFIINPKDPQRIAKDVHSQFRANRAALNATLAEEQTRLAKARQELAAAEQVRAKLDATLPYYHEQDAAYQKLAKDNYVSPIAASDKHREVIEKEQELKTQLYLIASANASVAQSEKRLAQLESDYRKKLNAERDELEGQLDKLTQELAKQTHKQGLLELKAPQDSVVKDLATHTEGTVVQPGTVLLTLVPQDEPLRAEVWVSNDDIGFVRKGQPVKLKFAAFPFQKYGMAEGTVLRVSADAADESTNGNGAAGTDQQPTGKPLVYKALVALETKRLVQDGISYELAAGMQTNAEIMLGSRTVAEYLLSPIQKAWHEAGRER
ncbi:HlyD family type I secretion periplasmic adaptor subunit [Oceanidesulfovibrio marinus]|uniref:HlyD family type I secretion periplasmic adaptor subunit n=1 Tax=Oceanidesulfovibrio marinus TaxID=370038 RepID=A0A6P1ZAA8_9BACT|nr:HlyD family type I secretion periplasmic adaptor subunit [Oceanidesulfovibrio marinus]TVM30464.1 HlyD family type I secretion periplasmic adaptor subunit [Oceanidesulfovibrio marinus]